MKGVIRAVSIVAASMFAVSPAPAQRQTDPPALIISGEATIQAAPDLVQLRAGVTSQGKTAREASEANAKAMNAVLAALKIAGIADSDVQTARLSLQPLHDSGRQGPPRITGFQATNQVMVKFREIPRVGEIVDALVGAGANEIGSIDFIVSEPGRLLDIARIEAVADARRKAEIYAKAAGVTLGRILGISEDGAAPPVQPMLRSAPAAMATPVMPGERTLRVVVSVVFQIIP